jgi:hypothetical protein
VILQGLACEMPVKCKGTRHPEAALSKNLTVG